MGQGVIISYWVTLGLGNQLYDIPLQNFTKMLPVVAYLLNTFGLFSNVITKTAFAITLLRIPLRWLRICVWAIIISMNLAVVINVIFIWTACPPLVNPGPHDKCMPLSIVVRYGVFTGGKIPYPTGWPRAYAIIDPRGQCTRGLWISHLLFFRGHSSGSSR